MRALGWLRKLDGTNPYELLRAEADGAWFTLWKSGKMSYQGARARAILEELAPSAGLAPEHPWTEVGSDEAGKGEWIGPLVAAAVALRPASQLALKLDGVRDSKELGADVRERLAERIRAHATGANIIVIGPLRFNELWDDMHARGETLNDLLWWAHRKALEPVLAAVKDDVPVRVVLDEFDRTRHARVQLQGLLPLRAEVDQRPHAEDALAVAAASVLARTERDRAVARLRDQYTLDERMTPEQAKAHPRAREFAKVAYLKEKAG
jgi:ribonuclease HIII